MALSINLDNKSIPLEQNKVVVRSNGSLNRNTKPQKGSTPVKPVKTRREKFLRFSLITIVIAGIFSLIFFKQIQSYADEIGISIKPTDLIKSVVGGNDAQLKRDSSGKRTNVLLVGIDTRSNNKGLQNTDTLIVASYNHETNETVMISIPRDFYAEIPGENWFNKINGLYAVGEQKGEGNGIKTLQTAVEEVTGLEIQYYGMVDLQGFIELVDIMGGLEINVERSFTDYMYPAANDIDYDPVSFTQGPQTMDGMTALKFSRSRQSQGPEGSDFARARRQQKVIDAFRSKALSSDTLLNPNKILDIMDSVKGNVQFSEITVSDIELGIKMLQENGATNKTYTFVLDPSIANYSILQTGVVEDGYSIGPKLGLGKYNDLHSYVASVIEDPALYELNPTIYVYDSGIGFNEGLAKANQLLESYPNLTIIYGGTLFSNKTGTTIYDNSGEKIFETVVTRFASEVEADSKTKPDYITTVLNGEDIVILFGKDISEQQL